MLNRGNCRLPRLIQDSNVTVGHVSNVPSEILTCRVMEEYLIGIEVVFKVMWGNRSDVLLSRGYHKVDRNTWPFSLWPRPGRTEKEVSRVKCHREGDRVINCVHSTNGGSVLCLFIGGLSSGESSSTTIRGSSPRSSAGCRDAIGGIVADEGGLTSAGCGAS